ncbi:MAG: aminodeoxychorismate/anthranilate synthase component II [Myxococcales bacterium]|nr:aminodeoxychorismate/anthranilate synthase component II [Myxococcales bacterium]
MTVLVVDNYDSFTFNLVQLVGALGAEVIVRRNDALTAREALSLGASHIVLSPGPGAPERAGISVALARDAHVPLLGVCLGHQALAVASGARVHRAPRAIHGRASSLAHDGVGLFHGVSAHTRVGRYHSLCVDERTLPERLAVIARSEDDGVVMALCDRLRPAVSVQFHPESVLSPEGPRIVRNFLEGRFVANQTRAPDA